MPYLRGLMIGNRKFTRRPHRVRERPQAHAGNEHTPISEQVPRRSRRPAAAAGTLSLL